MTDVADSPASTTVAVAGGTGFIGRHTVAALRHAGFAVVVLARRNRSPRQWHDDAGIQVRLADVGAGPPDLSGCHAVVNLVGIKAPRGANTFARAHIDVVHHLATAMQRASIRRLVHLSVVALPESLSEYARTKLAGEQAVRDADLDATILRPALVIGTGDDAMTNLIGMVRMAPVAPVATGPRGQLSVVDVRDVAEAVSQALQRPRTAGATIDVAGPESLDLRALIDRVAGALKLRTTIAPIPAFAQRWVAAALERVQSNPLVTRSQLAMLAYGLTGDPTDAERHLGFVPRPLTDAHIEALAAQVRDPLPSVRLVATAEHRAWLATHQRSGAALRWLAPLAVLAMLGLPWAIPNVWYRMAIVEAALAVVAWRLLPMASWRRLLAVTPSAVAAGVGAAAVMVVGSHLGFVALSSVAPEVAAEAAVMYAWPIGIPLAVQLPLLLIAVAGEDIVWRTTIGLGLAARYGPAVASVGGGLLFAVAHVTSGPPLLWLAAAVCGTAWTALLIRTRSVTAVIISHLLFDLTVLYWLPLSP